MNFCLSCCDDSKLLEKLAHEASLYGNYSILHIIQQIEENNKNSLTASTGLCGLVTNFARSLFSKKLPHKIMMDNVIKSDIFESVDIVNKMMKKNGMTITWDMIQAAQKRGVTQIIETLTGDPYDADHEKENVRLSIMSGDDKSVAGSV